MTDEPRAIQITSASAIPIESPESILGDNASVLLRDSDVKDVKSRLTMFVRWLDANGGVWYRPDLAAYRDHLMTEYQGANGKPLSNTSITAHLSTIRGRYREIMDDNATRDRMYKLTSSSTSAGDRKAFVDEMLVRLENAINPARATVKITKVQDVEDTAHLRLTVEQANDLLAAPGLGDIVGLRDTALIATLLCTGLREMELCMLHVDDLRGRFGNTLALRVRQGKGAKARMVPYGAGEWCLAYVDKWLALAKITGGAVFRAFYKAKVGAKPSVRPHALSVRAVQDILDRYPIFVDGRMVKVNPHDLRRTYARRLFDADVDPVAIQQNLGHSDLKTTLGYIGTLDAEQRRPPALFTPPHLKQLDKLKIDG